jgi:chaperone modulatory protein CbpM
MRYDEKTVVQRVRRLNSQDLRVWVSEGWVRPGQSESGPLFDDLDVARIRLLCDLRKDLSLSTDAVPVVLTLIDQLNGARHDLRCLAAAIERLPESARKIVIAEYSENQNHTDKSQ